MAQDERHRDILLKLRAERKELSVSVLSGHYGVTPLTIRRDLEKLEKEGALIRTHGGCVVAEQAVHESDYHQRISSRYELKRAIGKKAAGYAADGDMICINDGSTTFHLVPFLNGISPLSVYTNSIAMVDELSRHPGIEIVLLGGVYNRKRHCLAGSITEQVLRNLSFDTVFMGASSIDEQGRVLSADPAEVPMDRAMLEQSRKKILLADHTKVGSGGRAAYGKLADFDMWITTAGADRKLMDRFKKMTTIHKVRP